MEFKVTRNNELYHHGIKGQAWGVRNGPPYPLERHDNDSINGIVFRGRSYLRELLKNRVVDFYRWPEMSDDDYYLANELYNKKEEVRVSGEIYNRIGKVLRDDLSIIEKQTPVFTKHIPGYKITVVNKGYDEFKIIEIEKDESSKTWLDKIMDEVVGKGWEKYDY